jgi:multidrug efflux system membrane fusion protein
MASSETPSSKDRIPDGPDGGSATKKGHVGTWVVALLALVAGVVAYQLYSRSRAAAKDPAAPQPISVGVITVQKRDVPFYLTGLGTVTAFNTVTVHSRVDGEMMQVYFKEGQVVHAGDVLAEIDPRPFQVALDQAQGQLAKDVASQSDAIVNLARYQQLWQEGVIPRQQLDSQQATVGQFDGSIQSDKANINNEKLQLTYCRITSPIQGRVGLRLVDPGNIVHAADANGILVITQVQPVAVDFTLPEDNLPEVVAEMKKRELVVEAYSRDDNTKLAEGKLLTLDNQIDQTTGTIKLKSQFANLDSGLWPNQFVNVRLFLSVRKDAIVIPSAAIQSGAQGPFAYVVGPGNQVQVRAIQTDFNEGNFSVVRQGVNAGEQIVIDGQDKLQAGATVRPSPSPNPARAQGAEAPQGSHP